MTEEEEAREEELDEDKVEAAEEEEDKVEDSLLELEAGKEEKEEFAEEGSELTLEDEEGGTLGLIRGEIKMGIDERADVEDAEEEEGTLLLAFSRLGLLELLLSVFFKD